MLDARGNDAPVEAQRLPRDGRRWRRRSRSLAGREGSRGPRRRRGSSSCRSPRERGRNRRAPGADVCCRIGSTLYRKPSSGNPGGLTGLGAADRLRPMEALLVTGGKAPPRGRLEPAFRRFQPRLRGRLGPRYPRRLGHRARPHRRGHGQRLEPRPVERFPRAELHPRAARQGRDRYRARPGGPSREGRRTASCSPGGAAGASTTSSPSRALFERRRRGPGPSNGTRPERPSSSSRRGGALRSMPRPARSSPSSPSRTGAEGMSSAGLKWPLAGLRWGPGDCGVSNVARGGASA